MEGTETTTIADNDLLFFIRSPEPPLIYQPFSLPVQLSIMYLKSASSLPSSLINPVLHARLSDYLSP